MSKKRNKAINIPVEKISKDINKIVEPKNIIFSFDFLDRYHELFNLGDNENNPLPVEKEWFLDLIDCLRDVSKLTMNEFRENKTYDLHPVKWQSANIRCPDWMIQYEWWQFRINKSKGRIIGILIENCFHIVWLDRHHNLTDSEGYGKAVYYKTPLSLYDQKEWELERAYERIKELEKENKDYKELFDYEG